MKNIIKLLICFAISLILLPNSYAENFYIQKYDVNLSVNKNKQVNIIENIDIIFTKPSRGIIRDIPHNNASLTGVVVLGEQFKTTNKTTITSIKIGNPNKKITGEKHYTIRYDYNYHDNKNEFYHNIIGVGWPVPINKVTFKITLPDKIDPDKAGLSIGKKGTRGFKGGAVYTITGNVITGETQRILNPNEGITFRTPVKSGYFNKYSDSKGKAVMQFTLFLTIIAALMWYLIGKEKEVIPVVNFELPKEIDNILMAELIYNEKVTHKGIAALLFELANKGYLKINGASKSFTVKKLKDYETDSDELSVEKMFMKSLFDSNDKITHDELKTASHLYEGCDKILDHYNSQRNKLLYTKLSTNSFIKFIMNICVMGIIYCMLAFAKGLNSDPFIGDNEYLQGALIFLFLKLFIPSWNIFFTIITVICAGFLFFYFIFSGYTSTEYLLHIFCSLISAIIAYICAINLPRKKNDINKLKGQLEGLKKYIEISEKHELELMFEKDPQKFYDVLPYAYIFGLSKIWLDKIKDFLSPEFDSYNVNNIDQLANSLIYLSQPSYENGGLIQSDDSDSSRSYSSSSGGGGYSGGGGGGGGGSSW